MGRVAGQKTRQELPNFLAGAEVTWGEGKKLMAIALGDGLEWNCAVRKVEEPPTGCGREDRQMGTPVRGVERDRWARNSGLGSLVRARMLLIMRKAFCHKIGKGW